MDRDFGERGLQVLGINVDEQIEEAKRFLSMHPASFALASDASGQCPRNFEVRAMPASYLVDRKGVIRRVILGFRAGEADQIRSAVEKLLAEKTDND
jgi:peroxiredoxin